VEQFTYLALLLGWALPVIGLHWLVGAPELRRKLPLLAVAVLVPTVYLSLADAAAIGAGVWEISHDLTIGWRAGSLVFEEIVFFFLTNVMVAQSIVLLLSPSARKRAETIARRLVRRPSQVQEVSGPGADSTPAGQQPTKVREPS
jgi:lycopene cyclase domain-containing protein